MTNSNIKILVCYHKKDRLFKSDVLVPLHCGRDVAFEKSKDGQISKQDYKWFLDNLTGDNTGENISKLNRTANEWSAIYWAWKNYDKLGNPDYIGLFHYRRLFDFTSINGGGGKQNSLSEVKSALTLKNLQNIFSKYEFIYREGFKITDTKMHTFEDYQKVVQLSENYHPILYKYYQKFKSEGVFYCNAMFIMKREDFFNMCEETIPLIFDILNNPKAQTHLKTKEGNYTRYIAYLMEYIACFYFMYLKDKYKEKALGGKIYDVKEPYIKRKILKIKNKIKKLLPV